MSAGRTEGQMEMEYTDKETKRTNLCRRRSSCGSPGNVAVFGFMNPVCGVILSAVLLGETDSLSVMPVAALVLVCMEIYIVNRPEKTE